MDTPVEFVWNARIIFWIFHMQLKQQLDKIAEFL